MCRSRLVNQERATQDPVIVELEHRVLGHEGGRGDRGGIRLVLVTGGFVVDHDETAHIPGSGGDHEEAGFLRGETGPDVGLAVRFGIDTGAE